MDYHHLTQLHQAERDARILRAQYTRDLAVRAAVAVDLAIRRAATRLLGLFRPAASIRAVPRG